LILPGSFVVLLTISACLGRENDAVQANAQDGAGFNNANMLTPVDGTRGIFNL
jgi:hypothetical protein